MKVNLKEVIIKIVGGFLAIFFIHGLLNHTFHAGDNTTPAIYMIIAAVGLMLLTLKIE